MEFFFKRKRFRLGQFHSKCYVFGDYDCDYDWITTGKIQHLTMSKQLLIAFSLLDLEKVYQGRETLDAIQGWDRTLKSKLSAKTFHNHFPEGPFKQGRQSLAKNLPSECNRCCTHVMLQELTRGPTLDPQNAHENASVKAGHAQYSLRSCSSVTRIYW